GGASPTERSTAGIHGKAAALAHDVIDARRRWVAPLGSAIEFSRRAISLERSIGSGSARRLHVCAPLAYRSSDWPSVHSRNSDRRSLKRAMLPSCSPLSSLRAN